MKPVLFVYLQERQRVNPKHALVQILKNSKTSVQNIATSVLEELVFPWYEASTGKAPRSRVMRNLVAERIEANLTVHEWSPRSEVIEWEEGHDQHTPSKFAITQVFPQSVDVGVYVLMVSIHQVDVPMNQHVIPLNQFLTDFIPLSQLQFREHDS